MRFEMKKNVNMKYSSNNHTQFKFTINKSVYICIYIFFNEFKKSMIVQLGNLSDNNNIYYILARLSKGLIMGNKVCI